MRKSEVLKTTQVQRYSDQFRLLLNCSNFWNNTECTWQNSKNLKLNSYLSKTVDLKVGEKTLKSLKRHPSTHSSWWRRAEHVLQTSTTFCLSRRLQEVFARGLLEDVLKKTSCKHILQTSERRLGRWKTVPLKTASRRLQNVLENKKCLQGYGTETRGI